MGPHEAPGTSPSSIIRTPEGSGVGVNLGGGGGTRGGFVVLLVGPFGSGGDGITKISS